MATSHQPQPPAERFKNGKFQFHGCSPIAQYDILGKIGEGTFGYVSKARSKRTGAVVALKQILLHNEKDGFPITALREIKLLKILDHVNVLRLVEMAVGKSQSEMKKKATMYMVTPYMDHDLSGLLENPDINFTLPQIKCYMQQLLEGVKYLHENRILHRDLKAANLLINNKGILQIADFGLARPYDDEIPKAGRGGGEATREYTALVVTRWYRPPELLLSLRKYTTAVDIWGVGCILGEMFRRKPILPGKSDLDQAYLIFDLVGSPNDHTMPGWNHLPGCEGFREWPLRKGRLPLEFGDQGPLMVSLMSELMKLDWRTRINAIDALKHPWFHSAPLPAKPEELPRMEDSHELDRRIARGQKQVLPPAPRGGSVGMGEWTGQGPPPGMGNMPPGRPRPPPGTQQANGYNGPPRRPPPHDNGPPHALQSRVPGVPPTDQQRGGWQQNRDGPAGLPPKPPMPPGGFRPDMRDRDQRPPRDRDRPPRRVPDGGGVTGNNKVDTYIPSYQQRDDGYGGPPRRDRDRDGSYDRPGMYDDRMYDDRAGGPPVGGRRRGRSRSPDARDRDWRR